LLLTRCVCLTALFCPCKREFRISLVKISLCIYIYSSSSIIKSVLIGGVKTAHNAINIPFQRLSSAEFIGCMRRIQINKKQLKNAELLKRSVGVSVGCKRDTNTCASDYTTCGFGNRCIDRWTHHECQCSPSGVVVTSSCLRGLSNLIIFCCCRNGCLTSSGLMILC